MASNDVAVVDVASAINAIIGAPTAEAGVRVSDFSLGGSIRPISRDISDAHPYPVQRSSCILRSG